MEPVRVNPGEWFEKGFGPYKGPLVKKVLNGFVMMDGFTAQGGVV